MSLQDAIDVMPQGAFLAKLNFSKAYRSVKSTPLKLCGNGFEMDIYR